mmetsp:Transcript_52070/g.169117  ORF Transcript_52070/g.169117 Transcript_52070/m.169117 type:complete len:133 (-) Transcript_52070:918-1316(-)
MIMERAICSWALPHHSRRSGRIPATYAWPLKPCFCEYEIVAAVQTPTTTKMRAQCSPHLTSDFGACEIPLPLTVCWNKIAPKMDASTEPMDEKSAFESRCASWFNNTERILFDTPSTMKAVEEITLRTFSWK